MKNIYGNTGKMKTPSTISAIENCKIHKSVNINCKDNTKFQAASLSKILTALLILRLVEEGKLDLNKDVNNYLKTFKVKDKKGNLVKVTLKQLLSHTAGISASGFPEYKYNEKITSLNQIIKNEEIFAKSNKRYSYSGGGYLVIQKIIEDKIGKKFESLINSKILKPLKMNNSDFKIRKSKNFKIYPETAAAGLWSTSEDLGKLLIEIQLSYKGKSNKIISKKMTRKMLTPITKAEGNFMGLGVFIDKKKENFYHTGHNHKFRSLFKGNLKKGEGIVVMTNSDEEDSIKKVLKVVK